MLLNFLCGICFLSLSICAWVLTWNLLLMWNISRAICYTEMVGEWEVDPWDIQRLPLWPATRKNDAYGWQIPTTQPWASCPSILCHTEGVSARKNTEGMEGEYLNYSTQTLFHKLKECGYEDHKEPCDPINYAFTMAWMLTPGNYGSTSLLCTR